MRILLAMLLVQLAAVAGPVCADPVDSGSGASFITLGTQGGPMASAGRSQPANALLLRSGTVMMVDAGDGAAGQLARAGIPIDRVTTVFLSHLHFDHTAGMLGILGLHYQMRDPAVITIYGPPGTRQFVDGLVASMVPFGEGGYGIPGEAFPPPADMVRVVELVDGSTVQIGDIRITAAQNTHYSFPPGSDLDRRFKSLAYRFDLPDRSIVYTGDTGPSVAVEKLARGADLLVSEMIDVPWVLAMMERLRPNMPEKQKSEAFLHQRTQHLAPEQVGLLAKNAGVKRVVLVHLARGQFSKEDESRYRAEIGRNYSGPVTFAEDLNRF